MGRRGGRGRSRGRSKGRSRSRSRGRSSSRGKSKSRSGGRSSSRSRSKPSSRSGRTTSKSSRKRTRTKRTTSRPARKASKRTARASRRVRSVTNTRNSRVRTNTKGIRGRVGGRQDSGIPSLQRGRQVRKNPFGLTYYNPAIHKSPRGKLDAQGRIMGGIRPVSQTRVRFPQNRIPRTERLTKVWTNPQATKQLQSWQKKVTTVRPTKIKRPISLYEGYQEKNDPIGYDFNDMMLAGEKRYLPPEDTLINPRPSYQAFAEQGISQTDVMRGTRDAGFNFQQSIDKFMKSGLLIPIGAGVAGLIVLKFLLGGRGQQVVYR